MRGRTDQEPHSRPGDGACSFAVVDLELFISWSGDKSRAVALALHDWLPGVINVVKPFVSSKDIHAGTRWQAEIAGRLEASNFGIVCVTRENQSSTWLNFEAGALAKVVDVGRVVPLAVDLRPSDIQNPLGQFQAQPATAEGIGEILASVNATCDRPLGSSLLKKATGMWWPDLRDRLEAIENRSPVTTGPKTPPRSDRELLEELLDTVRSLARAQTAASVAPVESQWTRTNARKWELLNGLLEDHGGDVGAEAWAVLGRQCGYDPRGLGGFFAGNQPLMASDGERRILTEVGREFIELWRDVFEK